MSKSLGPCRTMSRSDRCSPKLPVARLSFGGQAGSWNRSKLARIAGTDNYAHLVLTMFLPFQGQKVFRAGPRPVWSLGSLRSLRSLRCLRSLGTKEKLPWGVQTPAFRHARANSKRLPLQGLAAPLPLKRTSQISKRAKLQCQGWLGLPKLCLLTVWYVYLSIRCSRAVCAP
jgi:hypothetical protein